MHIKTSRADMDQSAYMKDDQNDAAEYLCKERARATDDPRVRSALAAVARKFMRKARELDETSPGVAGIR
jgi:Flp pilus assembly protein TadD